jgi:hypothetical protein
MDSPVPITSQKIDRKSLGKTASVAASVVAEELRERFFSSQSSSAKPRFTKLEISGRMVKV